MELEVSFPGNKKVAASFKGLTILTDQPKTSGGDAAGPSPFDCFVASIGTCAGYYILAFCQERNIPTERIRLVQCFERDEETHLIPKISLDIHLPPDFPDKYKKAMVKVAEQCAVKKHLQNPPEVEMQVVD